MPRLQPCPLRGPTAGGLASGYKCSDSVCDGFLRKGHSTCVLPGWPAKLYSSPSCRARPHIPTGALIWLGSPSFQPPSLFWVSSYLVPLLSVRALEPIENDCMWSKFKAFSQYTSWLLHKSWMKMLPWGCASVLPSEVSEVALASPLPPAPPLLYYTFPTTQLPPLTSLWPSFCSLDWYKESQVLVIAIIIFIECLQCAKSITSIGRMPTSCVTLGK